MKINIKSKADQIKQKLENGNVRALDVMFIGNYKIISELFQRIWEGFVIDQIIQSVNVLKKSINAFGRRVADEDK
jgi:hypothetical protein